MLADPSYALANRFAEIALIPLKNLGEPNDTVFLIDLQRVGAAEKCFRCQLQLCVDSVCRVGLHRWTALAAAVERHVNSCVDLVENKGQALVAML